MKFLSPLNPGYLVNPGYLLTCNLSPRIESWLPGYLQLFHEIPFISIGNSFPGELEPHGLNPGYLDPIPGYLAWLPASLVSVWDLMKRRQFGMKSQGGHRVVMSSPGGRRVSRPWWRLPGATSFDLIVGDGYPEFYSGKESPEKRTARHNRS